jgi:hypothetical protein
VRQRLQARLLGRQTRYPGAEENYTTPEGLWSLVIGDEECPLSEMSIDLSTLRRQASAVGAACGNAARADLYGGVLSNRRPYRDRTESDRKITSEPWSSMRWFVIAMRILVAVVSERGMLCARKKPLTNKSFGLVPRATDVEYAAMARFARLQLITSPLGQFYFAGPPCPLN